jgi:hypothetical protein
MSRYAAIPLNVALSPSHINTIRVGAWSPIATGYHKDRAEKITKFAQITGNFDVYNPRSGILGPTLRRSSTCSNLYD